MMNQTHILSKGQLIDDKYTVNFFLKKGSYAETYRVKDLKGKVKLFKLFIYSKLNRSQFTKGGDVLEIENSDKKIIVGSENSCDGYNILFQEFQ